MKLRFNCEYWLKSHHQNTTTPVISGNSHHKQTHGHTQAYWFLSNLAPLSKEVIWSMNGEWSAIHLKYHSSLQTFLESVTLRHQNHKCLVWRVINLRVNVECCIVNILSPLSVIYGSYNGLCCIETNCLPIGYCLVILYYENVVNKWFS